MKIGSSGNGKSSTQSTGMGPNTVAGNVRDGAGAASGATMKTGAGGGAKKGLRESFLGSGIQPGTYESVSAGTPGGPLGSGGKNGTVTSSAASPEGRDSPKTMAGYGSMKQGKGPGARKGNHKGFL